MTILPVSDLHIDFPENYLFCRDSLNVSADVLVISGDLCPLNYKKRLHFIRKILLPRYSRIVCVPGNHEFYGCRADDDRLWYMHEIIIDEETGHTFEMLNNETVEIGGIRFICTCLWSPVLLNPVAIVRQMNDYHQIRGYTVNINNELNTHSTAFLNQALGAVVPGECKVIVITHHLPLWHLIDENFKHHTSSEAYANNLDSLLRVHDDIIDAWFYGHSHQSRQDKIYDILFLRNPLGYLFCENTGISIDKTLKF